MSPFKSEAQQRFLFSQKPKIAKEFSKKTDFKSLPEKVHLGCAVETAERYVKKTWNEKKGRFDYTYPSDIERQGRKEAKENLRASEKGDIPKKFKLSNIVEGRNEEMEHKSSIKKIDAPGKISIKNAAELIAKDHLKEDPNYYSKLKKMETADTVETAGIYEAEGKGEKKGDYKGGKRGRSWSWDDHKYRVRAGPKGDYRYNYQQSQKVPHTEAVVERKQKKEQEKAESRAAHEGGMVRLPISGELQNPGAQASRPSAGFRGRAASPRLPPQSRGRHMQNVAVKAGDVNIKNMMTQKQAPQPTQQQRQSQEQVKVPMRGQLPANVMPGAGQNTQTQGAGNSVGQNQNMAPARQAMKGMVQNTMVDQAKAQGNVYDSRALGREDFNKQDSSLNPLSSNNLTPEQQQKFGQCHEVSKQMSMKSGGQRYTTAGRNMGFHSITVHPDNTVFDHVLGINGMPLERYLALVPYSFILNP